MRFRLAAISLLLLSCLSLFAQIRGRGTQLQVSVRFQNDRPVSSNVRVQLLTTTGVKVSEALTNSDGTATFALRSGWYRLKLDGAEIEDVTSDSFQVLPNEEHTEWIRVSRRSGNVNAGSTISAHELNVAPQARKLFDRGLDAISKGDLPSAEKLLMKAVTEYPAFPRAWNNIGVIRMKSGDRAGAVEAWRKAIEVDDKFSEAYFNLARVSIADHQGAEAEQLVQKGLLAEPNSPMGIILLASAYGMQQQWEKSVATARRAHSISAERHHDAHLIAADGLLRQKLEKEAVAEYELYLQEFPQSPHATEVRNAITAILAQTQSNQAPLTQPN